ncbi:hypothetical protein GCK72_011135 [Caenorhabditis remanei]|uniref:Uncharacterized protein n=1 Tax=Caenorhabditis remanei TaxID=31234 RepID=A0A6A5H8Z6_CAERE|nr:hypothetical protein GCK72_011135 [Caenorhabditis remanei]KAF1762872.1 hypothetical protein GCK72_011135 [Caenorhabditis remanei]
MASYRIHILRAPTPRAPPPRAHPSLEPPENTELFPVVSESQKTDHILKFLAQNPSPPLLLLPLNNTVPVSVLRPLPHKEFSRRLQKLSSILASWQEYRTLFGSSTMISRLTLLSQLQYGVDQSSSYSQTADQKILEGRQQFLKTDSPSEFDCLSILLGLVAEIQTLPFGDNIMSFFFQILQRTRQKGDSTLSALKTPSSVVCIDMRILIIESHNATLLNTSFDDKENKINGSDPRVLNGTIGVVFAISPPSGTVASISVRLENGNEYKIRQIRTNGALYWPFRPCYATTFHKVQGMILSHVFIDTQ